MIDGGLGHFTGLTGLWGCGAKVLFDAGVGFGAVVEFGAAVLFDADEGCGAAVLLDTEELFEAVPKFDPRL